MAKKMQRQIAVVGLGYVGAADCGGVRQIYAGDLGVDDALRGQESLRFLDMLCSAPIGLASVESQAPLAGVLPAPLQSAMPHQKGITVSSPDIGPNWKP